MDRGWQATVHGVAKELDMTWRLNNNSHIKKVKEGLLWWSSGQDCASNAGNQSSTPVQGTSSNMQQLRILMPQLKILHAATKEGCSHKVNKSKHFFKRVKEKKSNRCRKKQLIKINI